MKGYNIKKRSAYTEMMHLGGCFRPVEFIDRKKKWLKLRCRDKVEER